MILQHYQPQKEVCLAILWPISPNFLSSLAPPVTDRRINNIIISQFLPRLFSRQNIVSAGGLIISKVDEVFRIKTIGMSKH